MSRSKDLRRRDTGRTYDNYRQYNSRGRNPDLRGKRRDIKRKDMKANFDPYSRARIPPNNQQKDITGEDLVDLLKRYKWMILIMSLGIGFRLALIGRESFWFDEAMTGYRSQWTYPQLLENISPMDHMPLYFTLIWMVGHYVGSSDIVLRLPSAIFGILTIIPAYYLGKRHSQAAAFASALFMAVIPTYVYYSQEARMYSLIMLLSSSFFFFTLEYYHRVVLSSDRSAKVGMIVTGILLLYTHYYSIIYVGLTLGSVLLIGLFEKKENIKERMMSSIKKAKPLIFTLMSITIWIAYLEIFYSVEGHETAGGYALRAELIPETFLFLGGMYKLLVGFEISPVLGFSICICVFFLIGVFLLIVGSKGETKNRELLLISFPVIIVPPLLAYLYSFGEMSIYAYRYFLFSAPLFVLVGAIAVSKLMDIRIKKVGRICFVAVLASIILMASISNIELLAEKEKEDWRTAGDFLDEEVQKGETIVPIPAWKQMVLFYYQRDLNITLIQPGDPDIGGRLDNFTAVWFVISTNFWFSDAEPILDEMGDWNHTRSKELNGLIIRKYER